MDFCAKCGKELNEAEMCTCEASSSKLPTSSISVPMPIDKVAVQGFFVSMKNRMGIGDPERNATDTYERGMQIIPENVSPNEGEIPVRQYNVAVLRNILRFERAEGRLQVTNKRVIFRAPGRSIGGRTTFQQEFNVDEIAGIEAKRGFRFSFLHLLFGIIVAWIAMFVAATIILSPVPDEWTARERVEVEETYTRADGTQVTRTSRERVESIRRQRVPSARELIMPGSTDIQRLGFIATVLILLIGFGGLAPFFLMKEQFLFKLLCLGASLGAFAVLGSRWNFGMLLYGIVFITVIVDIFLYCFRPDLAILIKNKSAMDQAPPVSIKRNPSFLGIFNLPTKNDTGFAEVMPTPESERAIREVGAIIRDIQTLGDIGVQKWLSK